MEETFGDNQLRQQLIKELATLLDTYLENQPWLKCDTSLSATYLLQELALAEQKFVINFVRNGK